MRLSKPLLRYTPAFLVIVAVVAPVSADIPQVMSYQGKVTDGGGTPVSDGSYPMRFQIYTAETGGTQLWDSGPQTVTLSGGIFSMMLGAGTMPALNLAFDQDYWLQVYFNLLAQIPRERLGSVGYAYMASGIVPGTEVVGSVSYDAVLAATNMEPSDPAQGVTGIAISPSGTGVCGFAGAASGHTNGVFGLSYSTAGTGVAGFASAANGATCGVYGGSASNGGTGVHGLASATTGWTIGVTGEIASTVGSGVYGYASATSGDPVGVRGKAESGAGKGVYGLGVATNGYNAGVYGQTSSTGGDGVHGMATATSGAAYGGFFETSSSDGIGVYGEAAATTGTAEGVYGKSFSNSGIGVFGLTTATRGSAIGVWGETLSSHGDAVVGWATASPGSTGCGIVGRTYSQFGDGVQGSALGGGCGVKGICAHAGASGVYGYAGASTGTSYGVYGYASHPSDPSRVGVYYSGGLAGTGSKSCVVKTSRGPTMLYCQESPECWFEDFGEGRMVNGRCHVELDPLFLETVRIDEQNPMKVFVELGGACEGVYVERGKTGFDVIELREGNSSVPFVYRVVAKRRDFERSRLEVCEAARTDPYLHPELQDKSRKDFERKMARSDEEHRQMVARRNKPKTPSAQGLEGARRAAVPEPRL